jgi:hypothetical protein
MLRINRVAIRRRDETGTKVCTCRTMDPVLKLEKTDKTENNSINEDGT